MSNEELKNEFNIHYNSIANKSAPSIDNYELSVYFTKAQLEIVKNYYDSLSNKKQKGFEGSEKRRIDLKELIKTNLSNTIVENYSNINVNSKFFKIPNDVFLIIYEKINVKLLNCEKLIDSNVVPVTHDEFNNNLNNPFKQPNKTKTWRLSVSKINEENYVELLNFNTLSNYYIRYIKYPNPIIISDLNIDFPEENLKIDNLSTKQECQLNVSIHREIIDRAVQLALRDYKPSNLESKIQIDTRNE